MDRLPLLISVVHLYRAYVSLLRVSVMYTSIGSLSGNDFGVATTILVESISVMHNLVLLR